MGAHHGSNGKRSPHLSGRLSLESEGSLARLTQREREVALLIFRGSCTKEIAVKLDISPRTVKAHLSSIYLKCGVSDRLQLFVHLAARGISAGDPTLSS